MKTYGNRDNQFAETRVEQSRHFAICKECGHEFTIPKQGNYRYCPTCKNAKERTEKTKICKTCGNEFTVQGKGKHLYCPTCKNEKESTEQIRICKKCRNEFVSPGKGHYLYCPTCRTPRKKAEQTRICQRCGNKFWISGRGNHHYCLTCKEAPKNKKTVICKECDMQFTVAGRGNFQYCPRCRPNHRKSSKYQPDPKRICKGCGQPFWSKGKREYCETCHPPKTIKICLNCHHSFTSLGAANIVTGHNAKLPKSKHGPGVGRQKMSDRHYFSCFSA